jgi:hypothetical protein
MSCSLLSLCHALLPDYRTKTRAENVFKHLFEEMPKKSANGYAPIRQIGGNIVNLW